MADLNPYAPTPHDGRRTVVCHARQRFAPVVACVQIVALLVLHHLVGSAVFYASANVSGGGVRFLFCLLAALSLLPIETLVVAAQWHLRYRTPPKSLFVTCCCTVLPSVFATAMLYLPIYGQANPRQALWFGGSLMLSALAASIVNLLAILVLQDQCPPPGSCRTDSV